MKDEFDSEMELPDDELMESETSHDAAGGADDDLDLGELGEAPAESARSTGTTSNAPKP